KRADIGLRRLPFNDPGIIARLIVADWRELSATATFVNIHSTKRIFEDSYNRACHRLNASNF
ncbi:MAG TPA: hypothetical protein VNE00_28670, partial [Paraburkholderia sp.]|nr:hypothetical protein [Paraburkholderia sp.]